MKANVNLEFSGEELENYGIKLLTKGLFRLISNQDPAVMQALATLQSIGMSTIGARPQNAVRVPQGVYPHGGPYGPPPGNVRPIRDAASVECCFPIEESRYMEPGWACCECATYNGLQRTSCRQCKHTRCGPDAQAPRPAPPAQEPI